MAIEPGTATGGQSLQPLDRSGGVSNLEKWQQWQPPAPYRLSPRGYHTVHTFRPEVTPWVRRPQETPWISSNEMIDQMHNADLLTPSERWLYNTMPRIMDTQVFGKSIGDRLEGFNEGWAGKLLNY